MLSFIFGMILICLALAYARPRSMPVGMFALTLTTDHFYLHLALDRVKGARYFHISRHQRNLEIQLGHFHLRIDDNSPKQCGEHVFTHL